MPTCPSDLRTRYREGRLLPFVGAGASISVSWTDGNGRTTRGPSWRELVDKATEFMGFDTPDLARVRGTDMQVLEYFKLTHGGETAKLKNWLWQQMNPPDQALLSSPIHHQLALLEKCKRIYTTNFDNFIERALTLHGHKCTTIALEMQMGVDDRDREIIKFHGDLDHPNHMVLTESDYDKRLALSTHMDFALRADLLGRVILFIGYSFRDPNVSYLFRLFTESFYDKADGLKGTRAFILTPDPSDFERQLFAERRIEVVPISGENATDDVAAILEDMRN